MTSRRVVLATGNVHKVAEVQAIVGDRWHVVAHAPDIDETGATFEDNALLKARSVAAVTGEITLADDSGIEIDALDGAPGVQSARWTDEGDWVPRVLREMDGVPEADRGCRYVCAAAIVWPGHAVPVGGGMAEGPREIVVRGTVEGRIADDARGSGGFGYDPLMVPVEGDGRTFAEMSDAEKHALSHRGRAFRALVRHLIGD